MMAILPIKNVIQSLYDPLLLVRKPNPDGCKWPVGSGGGQKYYLLDSITGPDVSIL